MTGMQVDFISHACLKIEAGFGTLLCDPWFLNEPVANFVCWKFPLAVVPPDEVVAGVDYVFVTHCHEDHFHIPSIDHFPRDVTFLLPEYDHHPGLRAQTMEITLRRMGFFDIRKLRSWETVDLGAGARFTHVPSAKSRSHDWENAGFVLEADGTSLLNMNDNLTDADLAAEITGRFPGGFDIGFIQAAGVSMYPGCFLMSEDEMRAETERRQISLADQRRMIELIGPRRIAPMAGDFGWFADEHFHNNWASRATPKTFRRLLENVYPDREIDLLEFLPGDRWSMETGLVGTHPGVDWDNMVDVIARTAETYRPKIEAIEAWIADTDRTDLAARSRRFTARIAREICREGIDFSVRARHRIEGPDGGFDFVLAASPETGFAIRWDDDGPVDQTLHVPDRVWAAILAGKLLWTEIQWSAKSEQHVAFRPDIASFWFWIENNIGLNNKQVQALIDPRLHPDLPAGVDPTKGVFPLPGEWERVPGKAPLRRASGR
ncbi:MAG: MBL fold metallo-hydrolase [Alphaproteobacteria bacterium]|nr:MBL fold metallo-hydrolase [Alphaproteobacteria bacterium]